LRYSGGKQRQRRDAAVLHACIFSMFQRHVGEHAPDHGTLAVIIFIDPPHGQSLGA